MSPPLALTASPCSILGCSCFRKVTNSSGCPIHSKLSINTGWMDGWADGWMDGWADGWMDGWADGWMDGWMDG